MTDRYDELEADVLSGVARALLDQMITFGYAREIAQDHRKPSLQRVKDASARLFHDVGAHMWRLGMPGIRQSVSVVGDHVGKAQTAGDIDAVLRAAATKDSELSTMLQAAIANDGLSSNLRNFLVIVLSRSEDVRDELKALMIPENQIQGGAGRHPLSGQSAVDRLGGRSLHVLVVEDDPLVAAVTTDMLQHLGWRATHISNAEQALAALSSDIDLLFSDVVMPGNMSGLDLAHEARRRRPGMPIILSTGYAERVQRQADQEKIPLLTKPYTLDSLAVVLDAARPR